MAGPRTRAQFRLVFIRSASNANALAALAGALLTGRVLAREQIRLVRPQDGVPAGTRVLACSFGTSDLLRIKALVDGWRTLHGANLILVAGGPHPSADPTGTLGLGFDHVFVGEGERIFPAFVKALLEGSDPGGPIHRHVGEPVDIDASSHAVPELGLFPFVEISRGCAFRCAFCSVGPLFEGAARHRRPTTVARGVRAAVAGGFKRFRYLTSDAFAYRAAPGATAHESLLALFDAVQGAGASQQMLGSFPSEVRPERVEPDLLALLAERCLNRTLVIGAQSGSDRVLSLMRRGHTVEQARRAIALTAEAGLTPHVDILFGFPGEEEEDRVRSLELIRWCEGIRAQRVRVHAHVFHPLPGTPAWPKGPEVLEPRVITQLEQWQQACLVDGDWRSHRQLAAAILDWRVRGLVRV